MLIGITCDHETITDRRGAPSPRYLLQESYVRAVERAGGTPVLLPHQGGDGVAELLASLAGLVISGGDNDVPPAYYGAAPHAKLGRQLPERSDFELRLCRAALARDLPLLGVCGGMQLLNVACGGSLIQDLSLRAGTSEHVQPHDKRRPHHPVAASGRLVEVTGAATLQVNSTHHQVVDRLGDGLAVCGVAPDGVIEAFAVTGRRFALGVQWHPEALDDPASRAIYGALVAATRR